MKLDYEGIKIRTSSQKLYFEIDAIDRYLSSKSFVINVKTIKTNKVLLVLSGEHESYKTFKGSTYYYKSFNSLINYFKSLDLFYEIKKNKYSIYVVILNKEDIIKNESKLYELCLLFRFSSIFSIKKEVKKKDALNIINKLSFYSLNNFKRWKKIIIDGIFFDAEHLSGYLIELE